MAAVVGMALWLWMPGEAGAQQQEVGAVFVTVGPSWSDMTTAQHSDQRPRLAWNAGIGYLAPMGGRFFLSVSAMYVQKGVHVHGPVLRDPMYGPPPSLMARVSTARTYFSLPFGVRYAGRGRWHPVADLGVAPAWLMETTIDVPIIATPPDGNWSEIGRHKMDVTDHDKPFDVECIAGLGLGWRVSERVRAEVVGRFVHGAMSMTSSSTPAQYNRSLSAMFGMQFGIGR